MTRFCKEHILLPKIKITRQNKNACRHYDFRKIVYIIATGRKYFENTLQKRKHINNQKRKVGC